MTNIESINEPAGYFGIVGSGRYGKLSGQRKNTYLRKFLSHIKENGPTSKYDLLIMIGKKGSKQKLRGYFSDYFASLRDNGLLNYDYSCKKHSLTTKSAKLIYNKSKNPELFL